MTWLFFLIAAGIVVATALALAGRWQPEGLAPQRPTEASHEQAQFDVVLRGYRMDQVDAELDRMHALLQDRSAEMPEPPGERTIEP